MVREYTRLSATAADGDDIRVDGRTEIENNVCAVFLVFLTIRRNKPISWGLAEYNFIDPGHGKVLNTEIG